MPSYVHEDVDRAIIQAGVAIPSEKIKVIFSPTKFNNVRISGLSVEEKAIIREWKIRQNELVAAAEAAAAAVITDDDRDVFELSFNGGIKQHLTIKNYVEPDIVVKIDNTTTCVFEICVSQTWSNALWKNAFLAAAASNIRSIV